MSATNGAPANMPVLVVDALELHDHLNDIYRQPPDEGAAYTESFGYKKTDIAPTTAGAVTVSRIVLNGDVSTLDGWLLAETTGAAAAAVRFHDGNNANTESFGRINIPSGTSFLKDPFGRGVRCFTGRIFLEVISGSVEGVIYWR